MLTFKIGRPISKNNKNRGSKPQLCLLLNMKREEKKMKEKKMKGHKSGYSNQ